MDYKRQYDLLMEKARQRGKVEGYKERHHIIPRCMGGSNKKENLVELTAREHYVAHRLLWMAYRTRAMATAFHMMTRSQHLHQRKFTNRQYETARIAVSEASKGRTVSEETRRKLSEASKNISEETRKKIGEAGKGRTVSEETRKKISESKKGKKRPEEVIRKMKEGRRGIPAWNKGKSPSEETRKKISKALKGRTYSDEYKKKMSETLKAVRSKNHRIVEVVPPNKEQKDDEQV